MLTIPDASVPLGIGSKGLGSKVRVTGLSGLAVMLEAEDRKYRL